MLYALPSQAAEVAEVGRQLGLSTVLAIGQILDHTGARLRVSMHGRTLVEMAIVRICQIGEMDDLAAVDRRVAGSSRRTASETGVACESQTSGGLRAGFQAQVDLKKNDEPRPATPSVAAVTTAAARSKRPSSNRGDSAGKSPTSAGSRVRRFGETTAPHVTETPTAEANGSSEPLVRARIRA